MPVTVFFACSVITCIINVLSRLKLNYSFMLLMHRLMLTKHFLAVAFLILLLAFFPKACSVHAPRHHGCHGYDSVVQLFCPSPVKNHLLISNSVTSCFSSFPQPFSPTAVQLLFLPLHELYPTPFSTAVFHCAPCNSPVLLTSFLRHTT